MLFGMTTALALQQVPLPEACDLDAEMLHITSSTPDRRRRRIPGTHPHVWKLIATHPDACVPIKGNVFALHPFHAWAQLSSHVSLEELVILAEAIITAISKSSGRYPRLVLSSLREFIDNAPYFLGKTACRTALQLVKANVLSPKESKARLVLLRHGLPERGGQLPCRQGDVRFGQANEPGHCMEAFQGRGGIRRRSSSDRQAPMAQGSQKTRPASAIGMDDHRHNGR